MTPSAYRHVEQLLAEDRCVVLDGGVATELQRVGAPSGPDPGLWGTWALYRAPEAVLDVHRSYVAAGCDVVSTNTWSILTASEHAARTRPGEPELTHWMDVARLGVRLARAATEEAGRADSCAVAFTVSDEAEALERTGNIRLLRRIFEDEPPDLLLVETLSLIRKNETYELVERLLELELPVWLSFRRCRHGVCGVYGQHWGPPEGDLFGRAARRFEEMDVGRC